MSEKILENTGDLSEKIVRFIENDLSVLEVKMILKSITEECYIVGGSVRDMILGITPHDFDFVVGKIDYDILTKAFLDAGWFVKETGKQFLVLMINKGTGRERKEFEIALLRRDGLYENGRRPDNVETGTILEDAMRRDFSINSLYFDLNKNEIIDPTGFGLIDITNKILRFNGKAEERMKEDFLRIFRAIRFLKKFNLSWFRGTERVFNRMFIEHSQKVNPQRVLNELMKM